MNSECSYETPELVVLGTVEEVTMGTNIAGPLDFHGFLAMTI